MQKSKRKDVYLRLLIFAVASVAFIMVFSFSTSPLYPQYWGADSAIFQVIGKGWAKGLLPYVNLFDHKGPLIFFIDALGYEIGAIWPIQVLFLFFSLSGVYNILSQSVKSEKWRVIFSLASLFVLLAYYQEGNLTEEYCLPFLLWSMGRQLSYFSGESITHKPASAFLYGITFGVCLMTRVTNAVVVCAFVAVISIRLALKGEWHNLMANAIAFLLGCAVVSVPFILYFYAHDALWDLFYGTILYNIEYSSSSTFTFLSNISFTSLSSIKTIISIGLHYYVLFLILITTAKEIGNKKYAFASGLLLSVALCAYVCLGGQGYNHYGMIVLPFYPVFVCILNSEIFKPRFKKFLSIAYSGVFVLFSVWTVYSVAVHNIVKQLNGNFYSDNLPIEILSTIPEEDHDSIVGYDIDTSTYLAWDILPSYTYFHHQSWQGRKSADLMEKIRNEYKTCETKWIIAPKGGKGIADILDDSYYIEDCFSVSGKEWNLYRLKA